MLHSKNRDILYRNLIIILYFLYNLSKNILNLQLLFRVEEHIFNTSIVVGRAEFGQKTKEQSSRNYIKKLNN